MVYKNLREKIGLDRCRDVVSFLFLFIMKDTLLLLSTQISGAAPLPMAVTEFLGDFDIPIYQLYGMSECTGVATYNKKG